MTERRRPPRRGGRLALGIMLLCIGVALLALNLGVHLPWNLWKYFPVVLIALGAWGLVSPSPSLDRIGGLWILAIGVYCLISVFGLFGLSWWSAWPVYVIATGVSVMLDRDACTAGSDPETKGGE